MILLDGSANTWESSRRSGTRAVSAAGWATARLVSSTGPEYGGLAGRRNLPFAKELSGHLCFCKGMNGSSTNAHPLERGTRATNLGNVIRYRITTFNQRMLGI